MAKEGDAHQYRISRIEMDFLEQIQPTKGEIFYNHQRHHQIKFAYISGMITPQVAKVERNKISAEILNTGWGSAQVKFPAELLAFEQEYLDIEKADLYFCGKSLATLLACQSLSTISEIGPFSLIELALAKKIGMPINDYSQPWYSSPQTIEELQQDQKPIQEYVDLFDLEKFLTRKPTPNEINFLSQHTFWDTIEYFLATDTYIGNAGSEIVKYRLRKLIPNSQNYPVLKDKIINEHTDYRPALANIIGEGPKIIQMFDWDNNGVWELDPDTFFTRYLRRTPAGQFEITDRTYEDLE